MAILKETETDELAGPEYNRKWLVDQLLRAEPLLWVYNRRVAFNDLTEQPLVAFPDGCAYRRAALATLERRAKPSFFAYTSASYENIRSAVSAGLGIGILPAGATTPDHFILTAREGFPKLTNVRLMLLYRSRGTLLSQLAEVLRRLVTQNIIPSPERK
jgi:DNA-binding transcriptional LysR family regulator